MFSPELWGAERRDVGYLHARAGAARALRALGERERARHVADAELKEVRVFGAPRALGVALRVAGLAQGGEAGLELLAESVESLNGSPALLERAHSLTELGAALRRAGQRAAAREPLVEALDLAARCGASRSGWSRHPPLPPEPARAGPAVTRSWSPPRRQARDRMPRPHPIASRHGSMAGAVG